MGKSMSTKGFTLLAFSALLSFVCFTAAQSTIGSASILAPAVILSNNSGSLTLFNLTVTAGNGTTMVTGPSVVNESTQQSAQTAAEYATSYLGLNYKNYDFNYDIVNVSNVSGPSAGAAMTLLALSALQHKHFSGTFTITGTISPNGAIGPIGGVYDKSAAAHAGGMKFIMVPAVPAQSIMDELYAAVQAKFGIPLVQVANISDAYKFAFDGAPLTGNTTSYDFYTNYSVPTLTAAPLSCSNNCNMQPFVQLADSTINLTSDQLSGFSNDSNFSNLTGQFNHELSDISAISSKGYLYTAADLSFLQFLNEFFISNANDNISISNGYNILQSIKGYCSGLTAPQVTDSNYEYAIAGRLRQLWGQYSINSTLSAYNSTTETTDDVLNELYTGAQSEGWCTAADKLYSLSASAGGTASSYGPSLANLAYLRLKRAEASSPAGMYTDTAKQAYMDGEYAVSIIGSDYAYAIYNASLTTANMSVAQVLNSSDALARNSTYGAWASQFANEAEFYIQEARSTSNNGLMATYADEAHSSAVLASLISNDTAAIGQSLYSSSPSQNAASSSATQIQIAELTDVENKLYIISLMVLAVAMGIFGLFVGMLITYVHRNKMHQEQHRQLESRNRSRQGKQAKQRSANQ